MNKCLISGATGLIGSHLVAELSPKEWQVYSISHQNTGKTTKNSSTRPIHIDLSKDWMLNMLPDRVDAVIHLAQSEYYRDFPDYAEEVFKVNTLSTLKLLEYARKVRAKRFIYASSGGIYGYGNIEFNEDRPIIANKDLGFYLGTKLCSEVIADSYRPYFNVIVLRFFFVYGPHQRSTMLIPRLVKSVSEGQPITLQGENGIKINPIYVTDAVRAIRRSLDLNASQKINVAGPEVLSLREIGEIIGELIGKHPIFELKKGGFPQNLVSDINKMSHLLGPPSVKFRDGIAQCLNKRLLK